MTSKVFFDTNILVYTIGQHDDRTPAAEALLASGGVISVQVLNELAAVARRKLGMSWPDVTEALGAITVLCPAPLPITTHTHDWTISRVTHTGLSPAKARRSRRFCLSQDYHWPGPRSLATTSGVSVDVLSSGY